MTRSNCESGHSHTSADFADDHERYPLTSDESEER